MPPLCLYYGISPADYWKMRARDVGDLAAFMLSQLEAREHKERMSNVWGSVRAKAGSRGRG